MEAFQIKIQSLTPENLNSVLELDKACFGGLWTLEAYQRELDSPNSDLIGLFSPVFPSKVLGMGCFWSILEEAHITLLAVHPQYQHQGFGQAVLYSLLRIACDRGLERATLEVRASNFAAISLYQKFGFKMAGRRRRYYKDNDEDALIFWLGDLQQPEFEKTLERFYVMVRDRLRKSSWDFVQQE